MNQRAAASSPAALPELRDALNRAMLEPFPPPSQGGGAGEGRAFPPVVSTPAASRIASPTASRSPITSSFASRSTVRRRASTYAVPCWPIGHLTLTLALSLKGEGMAAPHSGQASCSAWRRS